MWQVREPFWTPFRTAGPSAAKPVTKPDRRCVHTPAGTRSGCVSSMKLLAREPGGQDGGQVAFAIKARVPGCWSCQLNASFFGRGVDYELKVPSAVTGRRGDPRSQLSPGLPSSQLLGLMTNVFLQPVRVLMSTYL